MPRIGDFQQLNWVQPSALKMNHELCSNRELVAELRFKSCMSTLATAECADGCWTFKRVGALQVPAQELHTSVVQKMRNRIGPKQGGY